MRQIPLLPVLAFGLILAGCGGDATARSAQAPAAAADLVTDPTTGKKIASVLGPVTDATGTSIVAFAYAGEPSLWGIKRAGGAVVVQPVFPAAKVVLGALFVQPQGETTWTTVVADGTLGAKRWDAIEVVGSPIEHLKLRRGEETDYAGQGMQPISRGIIGDASGPNELLYRSKSWTDANLGHIGTQGTIRNTSMRIMASFPFVETLPRESAADLARYSLTYARLNELMIKTYYHATDPGYVVFCFGPYESTARRAVAGYRTAIRLNGGADAQLDQQARHGRVAAAFVLLSYDKIRVQGDELKRLVEELNEDLGALEAIESEKPFVEAYSAELQKLIARLAG